MPTYMVYFPGGKLSMAFHCTWYKNIKSYPRLQCPVLPGFVSILFLLLSKFQPGGPSVRPLDQGALPAPNSSAPFVSLPPHTFDLLPILLVAVKSCWLLRNYFLIPNCFLHFPFIARETKAVYHAEFLCAVNFFKVGLLTGL